MPPGAHPVNFHGLKVRFGWRCEQGEDRAQGESALLSSDSGDLNGKGKGALRRVLIVGMVVVCATILIGISTKAEGETWNEWEAASAASIAAQLSSYVRPPHLHAPASALPETAESDCRLCEKRAQMHQVRLQAAAGHKPTPALASVDMHKS